MPSQKLILNQKQSLKISPRQIQLLHFLQLNTEQLEERINEELETNPTLELGNEESSETDSFSFMNKGMNSVIKPTFESQQAIKKNIRAELKEQFRYTNGIEEEAIIADFIIDSVDDKGFLKNTGDELEDILSFGLKRFLEFDKIKVVIEKVSLLEPFGVASMNLQAFLLKQARSFGFDSGCLEILEYHFDLLGERKYDEIMEATGLSSGSLKFHLSNIASLKPYPFYGLEVESQTTEVCIIPEYKVDLREGNLVYGTLSRTGKKLVFNEQYGEQFSGKKDKGLLRFLLSKKDAAIWFIHALNEREETMNACIRAVVQLQEAYFISGSLSDLRPMILKDVATITRKTISSISRVTSQKYVQTHFGLISMKSLFTEAIQRNNGELISNKEVQEIVSKLVVDEDKQSPLTDAEICKKLALDGFVLTRRTITKYRESMNIPSSKLRRAL